MLTEVIMNHPCLVYHHNKIMDLNSKMKYKRNLVKKFNNNYFLQFKISLQQ